MKNEEILEMNHGKKFDIVLMNPPYAGGSHERFLYKMLQISNELITVQPMSWLIGGKKDNKILNKINNIYCNVEIINGNKSFDAGIAGNISITHINMNGKCEHIYNGVKYESFDNLQIYSNDNYLVTFANKLGKIKNSLWDNIHHTEKWGKGYIENPNENLFCIKIPQIRGNVGKDNKKESNDFYTIISNNNEFIENNKGKYSKIKTIPNQRGKHEFGYFCFETENELNNFINYIKTDFARTCLILSKTHNNQFRGCFKTIPWFDFSDKHFSTSPKEIDDWLFNKYNINNEIRKHIEKILPDYYDIRK